MTKGNEYSILGIDPGTRFMGVAALRGTELVDFGVYRLRNGERPDELIPHATQVLFSLIRDHAPQVVVIEAPYLIPTPRGAVLTTLAQVLHRKAKDLGIEVLELSPEAVRLSLTGDPRAKKLAVARVLADRFPQLERLVPRPPKVPALWLSSKERYWLHMFDALALAWTRASLGGRKFKAQGGLPRNES